MTPKRSVLRDQLGRDKETTISMCKYTSQCGERKACLDWPGLVWVESPSLVGGAERALYIPPR
jgi:hypothetical protein